jgi:ABC-2 type transport system permease protein
VLDRFLATPVSRAALIGGRIVYAALQVALQAAVLLAVATAVGARGSGGAPGIAVALAATALLGAAVAGCSLSLALVNQRQEVLIAVTNLVALPLMMLSTMMMSVGLMPDWMRTVARFNPVDWAVVAARSGFEGRWERLPGSLLLLLACVLVAGQLASRCFARYLRAL